MCAAKAGAFGGRPPHHGPPEQHLVISELIEELGIIYTRDHCPKVLTIGREGDFLFLHLICGYSSTTGNRPPPARLLPYSTQCCKLKVCVVWFGAWQPLPYRACGLRKPALIMFWNIAWPYLLDAPAPHPFHVKKGLVAIMISQGGFLHEP